MRSRPSPPGSHILFAAVIFLVAFGLRPTPLGAAAERIEAPIGSAGKLHYVDEGPRTSTLTPVLFVHSFAGSTDHWEAQIAHLRSQRRVVAVDLRGHGKSNAPTQASAYSVEAFASDIGSVADHLGIKQFVLVGHSVGAAAASAYALRNPSRVEGLMLVGAPGRTPREHAEVMMTGLRSNYDAVNERYWKSLLSGASTETETILRQEMQRMPRSTALAIIRAVFEYDPVPALTSYPGPKLIVDTTHGNGAHALFRQVPDVPRRVITGTSHWPHMDKPGEFNRLLDAFL